MGSRQPPKKQAKGSTVKSTRKLKPPANSPSPNRARRSRSKFNPASVPDASLRKGREIGNNLLDALGGRERFLTVLEDSTHPKAQALIDRLRSTAYIGENFVTSYTSVGIKATDIVQILGDVQQARVFIGALMAGDEVMQAVIRAAKDQIDPHVKCRSTGWVLDKDKNPTGEKCFECQGSGFILKSGARDAQDLYFQLLNWKKQGGMVNIINDSRRQNLNFGNQIGQLSGTLPGQAPDVQSLIRRADQLVLPSATERPEMTAPEMPMMPEDAVEAEVV